MNGLNESQLHDLVVWAFLLGIALMGAGVLVARSIRAMFEARRRARIGREFRTGFLRRPQAS